MKFGGSWSTAGKVAANAVIGGTAAELGGGKFANGAITSAYAVMFNHLQHKAAQRRKESIASTEVVAIKQRGINNCLPASGSSVNKSLGGNLEQEFFRTNMGGDPDNDPLPVVGFWNKYASLTGHTVKGYSPMHIGGNIVETLNNGGMVTLGLTGTDGVGHSVVLQSITAIYNGDNIQSFSFRVMDPGTGGFKSYKMSSFQNFLNKFETVYTISK